LYEDRNLDPALSLARANRRLQAVLDNASAAIFLMDDRQQCIYMNAAAEHLTGFTLEEVLALDRPLHDIIHHTHPDGRPFPLHDCAIDRAFPEHNRMRGEEMFVHKDGHFYPVAYCASPIEDDSSKTVGTIIEVRDIAAEKRAEAHRRVLVDELNHRVKNTLATVQSIARQTFLDSEPSRLTSFTNRLRALSQAHEVLTRNSWEAALLGDVANSSAKPFGRERFVIEGPRIRVSPKLAVSLTMALHELATNACKYGALAVPSGHVRLVWETEEKDGLIRLTLVWEERGGPAVLPPERKGFGIQLIENQLVYEFGGEVNLAFAPEGLRCRVHFAVPAGTSILA
jgi:PAS domain S-box-containing protein